MLQVLYKQTFALQGTFRIQKHIDNSDDTLETEKNIEHKKRKIFCCDNCEKFYMSNQALNRHQMQCKNNSIIKTLKNINDELLQKLNF